VKSTERPCDDTREDKGLLVLFLFFAIVAVETACKQNREYSQCQQVLTVGMKKSFHVLIGDFSKEDKKRSPYRKLAQHNTNYLRTYSPENFLFHTIQYAMCIECGRHRECP
jgi:hypothetical protein